MLLNKKFYTVFLLSLSFIFVSADVFAKRSKEIKHSIFIAGPRFTGIIGEDGEVIWDSKRGGARDGYVLENGNILICWSDKVVEYNEKKEIIFTFLRPKREGKVELSAVQRLENGNTLIVESSVESPRIMEVDKSGKVLLSVPLQPETENVHMQTRMARKLKNGNYLAPHLFAFAIKEYTPQGKVVKTIKTDLKELGGSKVHNWPFTAIRLKNGNTVANLTNGNKTAIFDADGKLVWSMSNNDVEGTPFRDPCGGQVLKNGNIVICSYGAKDGVKIFEVNKNKEIVWKYEGYRAHDFQILTTNGKPIKYPLMK